MDPSAAAETDESEGVCLCIVFNHPFTENIPVLREVYRGRFRHVRFLVPLERSDDPDVLTVYRGSFSHNAYCVDVLPSLREIDCSHYFFLHDDVLLNPGVSERNLLQVLGVKGPAEGYLPLVRAPERDVGMWGHWAGPLWRLLLPRNFLSGTGVDSLSTVLAQLPSREEAARRMSRFGAPDVTTVRLSPESLSHEGGLKNFAYFGHRDPDKNERFLRAYLEMLFDTETGEGALTIPYPFVYTGPSSDICLVPKSRLEAYAHISGVLAAAGLFVEVACPTALALACETVRCDLDAPLNFTWSVRWVGFGDTLAAMEADPSLFAAHPLKLSTVPDKPAMLDRLRVLAELPVGVDPARSVVSRTLALAPDFDPAAYLDANPDVRAAGMVPYLHFLRFGHREGRALRRAA